MQCLNPPPSLFCVPHSLAPPPPSDVGRDIESCQGASRAFGRPGRSEHLGVGSNPVRDEL